MVQGACRTVRCRSSAACRADCRKFPLCFVQLASAALDRCAIWIIEFPLAGASQAQEHGQIRQDAQSGLQICAVSKAIPAV
jgi:hypothetical protein